MINQHKINRDNVDKKDRFDHVLDALLSNYTSVAPRTGLEERVLANLRAERARVAERAWWGWGLAATVVVLVMAMTLAWRLNSRSLPVARRSSAATQPSKEPPANIAANSGRDLSHANRGRTQPGHLRSFRPDAVIASGPSLDQPTLKQSKLDQPKLDQPKPDQPRLNQPRLNQFPSPQPLSDQELALARYVSQFPHDATLIAKAQEEYEKEMQRKMQDTGFENEDRDSEQQER